jgi:hypothetical protein
MTRNSQYCARFIGQRAAVSGESDERLRERAMAASRWLMVTQCKGFVRLAVLAKHCYERGEVVHGV